MRQGSAFAYLAPEGWGGERKGKMEGWRWRFVASRGLRFFSWGLSVLFSSFFVAGGQP